MDIGFLSFLKVVKQKRVCTLTQFYISEALTSLQILSYISTLVSIPLWILVVK